MMFDYYGSGLGMMGGIGFFGQLVCWIVVVDLVLLGVLLWQHIHK